MLYQYSISTYIHHQVDTPTGSSTVYVHGFGTDDSYHSPYGHGHAYGYGHIDPYLNHKQVVAAVVVGVVVLKLPHPRVTATPRALATVTTELLPTPATATTATGRTTAPAPSWVCRTTASSTGWVWLTTPRVSLQ